MDLKNKIRWIAIGDSFTFMNDQTENTDYRVQKGYLDRVLDQCPQLELFNMGIDGSTTALWLTVNVPKADLYTILLGTNDWFFEIPLGTDQDFREKKMGTILGNLAFIIARIQRKNPEAKIIVMNPVERGEFVCILDYTNVAHDSSLPQNGIYLKEVSEAIYRNCKDAGIACINLHDECGFTPENVVNFKRVKTEQGYQDLTWPEYTKYPFDPENDEYPYPLESIALTYDGLHPSDKGNQILADILAKKIKEILK